jgi:hypothetical protein
MQRETLTYAKQNYVSDCAYTATISDRYQFEGTRGERSYYAMYHHRNGTMIRDMHASICHEELRSERTIA